MLRERLLAAGVAHRGGGGKQRPVVCGMRHSWSCSRSARSNLPDSACAHAAPALTALPTLPSRPPARPHLHVPLEVWVDDAFHLGLVEPFLPVSGQASS